MLFFLKNKVECSGCGACVNICPVNCIEMKPDEEGFIYPVANDNCIHCNKCEQVCPSLSRGKAEINQKAYAGVTKDYKLWEASTSGGTFGEICKTLGDRNTIIYGVELKKFQAQHKGVKGVENISNFHKSKYIQSNPGYCYKEAQLYLEQGLNVIFSGTPCQIAGLKNFLGRDYSNLISIDFICHGVGSPLVFHYFINHLERKENAQLLSYSFREKVVRKGHFKPYVSKHSFANQKPKFVEMDGFIQLFLNRTCNRPSCEKDCKFKGEFHSSDITIADFKKFQIAFPKIFDIKNYSTIITNTKKGKEVLDKLKYTMIIKDCDMSHIHKYNPQFFNNNNDKTLRDEFFSDLKSQNDFDLIMTKYTHTYRQNSILQILRKVFHYRVFWIAKLLLRKLHFTK